MKSRAKRWRRSDPDGNILVLVLFFSLLVLSGLFAYWAIVRAETRGTSNVVREIVATAIGDGVSAELVSIVNRAPWEDRFYRGIGMKPRGPDGPAAYYFSHGDYPFLRKEGLYRKGHIKFFGAVKDLDLLARTYRVYLEVWVKGYSQIMSWDIEYRPGFVRSMNRVGANLIKALGEGPRIPEDTSDRILDRIKEIASDPSHTVTTEEAKLLKALAQARGSLNQQSGLPAGSTEFADPDEVMRDAEEAARRSNFGPWRSPERAPTGPTDPSGGL